MLGILGTVLGSVGGIAQNIAQARTEKQIRTEELAFTAKENDKQRSFALEVANKNLNIQDAVNIQKQFEYQANFETTEQERLKTIAQVQDMSNAPMEYKIVRFAWFITTITRPFLTLLVVGSTIWFAFAIKNLIADSSQLLFIFEALLFECTGITSYWFVRRSYEKSLDLKKK